MKILYFLKNNETTLGVSTSEGVIAFPEYGTKALTKSQLAALSSKVEQYKGEKLDVSKLSIQSCTPNPSKIICIGLNYRKHAEESGMAIPPIPVVFTKYSNTLIPYGAPISLGPVGEQFDYEVELGVVIGEKCKHVSKENALDYVLGYCTANDMSCRDLQFRSSQWLMGKSLDTFLPLGKYVVTGDEVGDPQQLQLKCIFNGEERQNSNTSDMIFTIAEIIEDLSKHMTLEPGDLILTGTPAGVILGLPVKNWMKPGDVVTVEIEKLGSTTNTVIA